jgi:preprotein translocase subunit SecE
MKIITKALDFARETRRETSKVTWPSRKETIMTTAMVMVMAVIASIFFLLVDQGAGYAVRQLLRIGG